jgi:N-acetyl sugar amidotransferase
MILYKNKNELVKQADYVSRFDSGPGQREALYGLPSDVAFCTQCVISNQRPNSAVEFEHTSNSRKATISLDDEGICDACRSAEAKRAGIDWQQREQQLQELCDQYRKEGKGYDCLVSGSGGKDSFYAAHNLKYKYGMSPLTVTWAPHLYTPWGWENFQAWINAGFDNYLMTPNSRVHRLITRLAVENLFHPFQPFMFGQKALAPKMAALFDIPLVFYGENEAEYGNPLQDTQSAERDWSYFTSEDQSKLFLGGVSVKQLQTDFDIQKVDLEPYLPVDPQIMSQKGIQVHYLGYYLPWHPQGAYYYAVENGGFKASPERTPGTYSKYNSIDDKIDDFHYYTTYIKFGIGRATYDAAQEIRNDEITREEGVALVKKYDGEFPSRFADEIFRYLSIPLDEYPVAAQRFEQPLIDRDYFEGHCDLFRSPHLWKRENGVWQLRHTVWGTGVDA